MTSRRSAAMMLIFALALTRCTLFADFDALHEPDAPEGGLDEPEAPDAGRDQEGGMVSCDEPGATMFEGHCYFPLSPGRAQPVAKRDCELAGAHLVTITGVQEQSIAVAIGSGDRWIGLEAAQRSNDPADYKWITGEPMVESFWYPGDPDELGPCAAMHRDYLRWVDRGCDQIIDAICERE